MAQQRTGDLARGMAGAPLAERTGDPSAPDTAAKKKENRFAVMLGAITFKAVPQRKAFVFETGADKGTEQTTVADVILENVNGIENVHQMGYRIVKRISADKKKIKCVVVTPQYKIGPVSYPFLNLKEANQDTKDEYSAFLDSILNGFYSWAEKRAKSGILLHDGKALGGSGAVEQEIDSERAAALGLG